MSKQSWSGVLIGLALSLLLLGACGTATAPTAAPVAVSSPTPPAPTPQVEGEVSTFSNEGVQVTVPTQATPVHVVKLDLVPLEKLPTPVPGGFEPFRAVINVDVQYDDGKSVQEFNPPIEISVRYTSADFENAAKVDKPLSLGYWDGSIWRVYTAEKHSFKLVPDGKEPSGGGWGVVLVSNWGDPMDAWGR